MHKTPGEMHMYDMVKIDTIVFEIVGGGGLLKPTPPPPPGSLAVRNSPDRIGLRGDNMQYHECNTFMSVQIDS